MPGAPGRTPGTSLTAPPVSDTSSLPATESQTLPSDSEVFALGGGVTGTLKAIHVGGPTGALPHRARARSASVSTEPHATGTTLPPEIRPPGPPRWSV